MKTFFYYLFKLFPSLGWAASDARAQLYDEELDKKQNSFVGYDYKLSDLHIEHDKGDEPELTNDELRWEKEFKQEGTIDLNKR